MSVSDLQRTITTVTIANGATTSSNLELPFGHSLVAIDIPSALTGTAFTFQCSADGGTTWDAMYFESTQYSVSVGVSRYIALDPRVFCAARLVRLVSGSSEGAERTIRCIYRPVH